MKRGWKLLDNNRESISVILSKGGVKYRIGELTTPKSNCGPLAVFKTRLDAERFTGHSQEHYKDHIIVPCIYKPSLKRVLHTHEPHKYLHLPNAPLGTVFADIVVCLK